MNFWLTKIQKRRHLCEVASVVRMYKTKGAEAVKKFLLLVEKERGSTAAQRLRNDALKAIKDRK